MEIFNKRQFCCDCGNPKFKNATVPFCEFAFKSHLNAENKYGHNFAGRYCYCDSKYDEDQDTMLQCILCEDWFHERCISVPVPPEQDQDMFCKNCILNHPCLQPYVFCRTEEINDSPCSKPRTAPVVHEVECFLDLDSLVTKLCRCAVCLQVYHQEHVDFLLRLEEIEAVGSNTDLVGLQLDPRDDGDERLSIESIAMSALNSIPRSSALDIASGLQEFLSLVKSELKEIKEVTESSNANSSVLITEQDMNDVLQRVQKSLLGKRKHE
eukprot:TRINITY_DN14449_c0_g1_i2.p1 TRINITY_DN14449_c0_g1~~TRINITY_DN14449_c0_g1_i2.p1  ORF type:complete len:268 (-),score=59.06 TRINITY_DN14449_c0_g1_i2:114-917(-)